MFMKDFQYHASLCVDEAAQEARFQSYVLNSEQSGVIATKWQIQYSIDFVSVFILLLFGKSDLIG